MVPKLLFAVALIATTPGFAFDYKGDGKFTDGGFRSAFNRYRLVLPPVNLCEASTYSFNIGELPADTLFLQIDYVYPKELSDDEAFLLVQEMSKNLVVKMALKTISTKAVEFEYRGKIYESGHDEEGKYWRKGFPGVVMNGINGYGLNDHIIVFRVDDVNFYKGAFWQRHSAKQLFFEVLKPLTSLQNCSANFAIVGGGWK